jgi:hypothetical protein
MLNGQNRAVIRDNKRCYENVKSPNWGMKCSNPQEQNNLYATLVKIFSRTTN